MTELHLLWLPILVSTVFVFIASSIIHMVLPWHKSDYPKMPREDEVLDALRPFAIPPGDYMVPRPSRREDLKSPQFLEKLNKGPVMVVSVWPNGMMNMGRNLAMWFVYLLVVGVFTAIIVGNAASAGSWFSRVFHYAAPVAFMGYSVALWQLSIWYRRSWSITIKATIDGVIYALITAATFGWLWPR
jgi:hypothetical protein